MKPGSMKSIAKIATEIAKREKNNTVKRRADIRGVLNLLGDMCFEDAATVINTVYSNGLKRRK